MNRVWWIVRIAVILAASYCIFAPGGAHTLQTVQAEVATQVPLARGIVSNNCYCPDVVIGGEGCTGCFVRTAARMRHL